MQIHIKTKGLPGSSILRRLASGKLHTCLLPFSGLIQDATLCFSDINGPLRGGIDKLCRLVLVLNNSSVIVIEELGSDFSRITDRVIERLARQLSAPRGLAPQAG